MTLAEAKKAINPERLYSLNETVRKRLIPWVKSYQTLNKEVLRDQALPKTRRIIDAQIIGEGNSRTIRIMGKNWIKYIEINADKIK